MKIILSLAITLAALLIAGTSAFGGEGHDAVSAAAFRIDSADIRLAIDPPYYREGKVQRVEVTLTDSHSSSPVMDADMYLLVVKKGQADPHAGHIMPKTGEPSASTGPGLDFGEEPPPAAARVDLSMFRKLMPSEKAGVYAVEYPLPSQGEYTFTLAVTGMQGKKYAEPILFGGDLRYIRESEAPFYRMLAVLITVITSGIIGIWVIWQRTALGLGPGQKISILDIPWVNHFMKSRWFQPVFQVPTLIVFLIIMAAGLFDVQQGDRNIATLLTWTIWWAAIIFTFVLMGRVWCMACPVGAVQDWVRKLVRFERDFPRPLRNMWLSSILFFGLTAWDGYGGIVNKPALTAYILIGIFAVAVAMALLFKGRTFCRYVCPIGGLIGLYSMASPLELRNRCLEVCRKHQVKECVKGTIRSNPCPMFQTPMTLDRNNYCNFCSECIKSCSQNNIVIRFRSFAKDIWVSSKGYLDEAFLALVILGVSIIVTAEMIEPWHRWMDSAGRLMPFDALGVAPHAQREKITFLAVLFAGSALVPLLLLAASLAVRRLTGPESPIGLKATFVQFAYMFIPVGISMHLAHNISHLFKEGPEIVPALKRAAFGLLNLGSGEPDWNVGPLMGNEAIFWLQMLVLMMLTGLSLYAGYRIAERFYGDRALKAFIPMALLAVFFMTINVYILGQPMALRHTH